MFMGMVSVNSQAAVFTSVNIPRSSKSVGVIAVSNYVQSSRSGCKYTLDSKDTLGGGRFDRRRLWADDDPHSEGFSGPVVQRIQWACCSGIGGRTFAMICRTLDDVNGPPGCAPHCRPVKEKSIDEKSAEAEIKGAG